MNILQALSKQFFGAKYERVVKSLITCIILFLAAHATGIEIKIAPSVLFLAATVSSTVIMWQTLNSSGNTDRMTGMFMLPFQNRGMTFSLVLVYTGYTLITRTFPILALFFAVYEWSTLQIAASLLCACNGCLMAAAWYTVTSQKKLLPFAVFWCGTILFSIFSVREIITFSLIVLTSMFLSCLRLLMADPYVFYRPLSSKILIRHTKGTGSILLYLMRYLLTNKNYLINTTGLCVIAGAMPLMLGQFEGLYVMPLGFAVLCLNTPICILLSCDPDLEQSVRTLPGQAERFCTRYCLFIFSVNIAVNSVYLVSWQIRYGRVGGREIITALLIAWQSAVLSVLLEWFYPIRNRKVASDLWHHPRKYIVPLIMLLIAELIGMWPVKIWILLCIVIAEVFSLSLIARRI